MIRRYITLIYCSATLSGLFALPTAVVAQEQTMTREERIKALERLKMEDARWETVTVMQTGKEVPLEIENLELPPPFLPPSNQTREIFIFVGPNHV